MMIWRKIRQIDFVERLTVSQYSMEKSYETRSYSKISVKSTRYLDSNLFRKKRWFDEKMLIFP